MEKEAGAAQLSVRNCWCRNSRQRRRFPPPLLIQ